MKLEDAIALAAKAHKGQRRRDGEPYIMHPIRVMQRLHNDEDRIAAILHDVVEDTEITLDDLRALGYSSDVVDAIDRLSRRDGETYEDFIERVAQNPIAVRVKLEDLSDNMGGPKVTGKDCEREAKYRRAYDRLAEELRIIYLRTAPPVPASPS